MNMTEVWTCRMVDDKSLKREKSRRIAMNEPANSLLRHQYNPMHTNYLLNDRCWFMHGFTPAPVETLILAGKLRFGIVFRRNMSIIFV